jgi:hypothetical protein
MLAVQPLEHHLTQGTSRWTLAQLFGDLTGSMFTWRPLTGGEASKVKESKAAHPRWRSFHERISGEHDRMRTLSVMTDKCAPACDRISAQQSRDRERERERERERREAK